MNVLRLVYFQVPKMLIVSLLVLILVLLLVVCSFAWHYRTSPLNVIVTLSRSFMLKIIALAVRFHDPSSVVLSTPLGPLNTDASLKPGTQEQLSILVNSIYPYRIVTIPTFENNPIIFSKFKFSYQPVADIALICLKDKFELSKLLFLTANDFEQLILISDWVHRQWEHGTSGADIFNPGEFNADIILSHARKGAKFWCHVYSMTFIQIAASLGYQARLVALTKDGYESSDMHAVAEVWSCFYRKWITIDTDFNIWYSLGDIPLSTLEIHNAVISGKLDSISINKGEARPAIEFEDRIPTLFSYYHYFYIDMRNDWLTNRYFRGHPARSDQATLFWSDERLPAVLTLKTKVKKTNDLYWDVNGTELKFASINLDEHSIGVDISTHTPNFSHFLVRIDEKAEFNIANNKFVWSLHLGTNVISVCAVNISGLYGIPSLIVVQID